MKEDKYNVVIFHAHNDTPESHWYPWVKNKLNDIGVDVYVPEFPLGDKQKPEDWDEVFLRIKEKVNKNTILIGHSLGGAMILRVLQSLENPVKGVVLVGGFGTPFGDTPTDIECNEFVKDLKWKKIKANMGKVNIFASTNDPSIPIEITQTLSLRLNNPVTFFEKSGHFCKNDGFAEFPQIIEAVRLMIQSTYDDFKKVEMKAGTIVSVEVVEDADKLYKFMVDLGEAEPRQILSAIREYFPEPDFFVGKQFMFVSNLEPRTIRGFESNGMILAVDDVEGNPMFVTPKETVPNGSAMR